ncbi:MAG: deoxyribonuclease V [Nitrospirae bacterium]|nr:deoxyribonuclease V [Nitrospirota bacterium]MCL5978852.1 deoxyribonuclease V [Nitrospirota bacterium]
MVWPLNIKDAKAVQEGLRHKVKIFPLSKQPRYIAAADAAFIDDKIIAAVCVYKYQGIEYLEHEIVVRKITFPYIPGYLTFREGPAIVEAIKKLKTIPDVIIFDGQGIAHPKGLGIASHIGVLLDMPTIGCAKSRLTGTFKEPGQRKGQWSRLMCNGKTIGAVLRTRDNVRPVFVSAGHKIDLKTSVDIIVHCTGNYRIPLPQRCADMIAKSVKKDLGKRV